MKFSFSVKDMYYQEFWHIVVTYRVTNFLPKLLLMILFSTEKIDFPYFEFPIIGYCHWQTRALISVFQPARLGKRSGQSESPRRNCTRRSRPCTICQLLPTHQTHPSTHTHTHMYWSCDHDWNVDERPWHWHCSAVAFVVNSVNSIVCLVPVLSC